MRIDKIRVKNFKGFSEEVFELNPHFTVFTGDNAKGKTSVLDALAVAAGSFLRGIDAAANESRGIDKNEIRVVTEDIQPLSQLPVEIHAFGTVNGKNITEGWLRTIEKLSKKTTTTFKKTRSIVMIAEEMLKQSRSGRDVLFPVIAYHGTGRLWAEHEEKKATCKKTGQGVSQAYNNCLSPIPGNPRYPNLNKNDSRWRHRRVAREWAVKYLPKYEDGRLSACEIAEFAAQKGFFSVWFSIYNSHDDVKKALIESFIGTAINCFDNMDGYKPVYRNPNNPADPI